MHLLANWIGSQSSPRIHLVFTGFSLTSIGAAARRVAQEIEVCATLSAMT